MTPQPLSRRRLLKLASAGAVIWLGELVRPAWCSSKCHSWRVDDQLISLCSRLSCSKAFSSACLFALPSSERHLNSLSAAVLSHSEFDARPHPSPASLAQIITAKARADFLMGSILPVNGWLLAETEVRLYALAGMLIEGADAAGSIKAKELPLAG